MSHGLPPIDDPTDEAERSDRLRDRYRVVLVRLPRDGQRRIASALPGGRPIESLELPLITRITSRPDVAERTADRLRAAGAIVVITHEPAVRDVSAFCEFHPHRLAPTACRNCQGPICDRCVGQAGGEEICPRCYQGGHSTVRRTRLRQLFVIFLFAVFVYEVVGFVQEDQAGVAPNGRVKAVVIQLVEPTGGDAPILQALNLPAEQSPGRTLHGLGQWYSEERARYGGPAAKWMEVDVLGPWPVEVRPPDLEDPSLFGLKRLYNAWRWPRYFHDLADEHGVDIDDYGVRAYVIYGGTADMAAHSRGSEKGRIAVSWIALDERNPGYAVLTVAHEMGHALGAQDRYDPRSYQSAHPEGYVEPFADPLYPQRYAELMAVDVPLSLRTEREVVSMSEVRIGHQTAAEMGWISTLDARAFYTPPALGPIERLPGRSGGLPPATPDPEPPAVPAPEGGPDASEDAVP